MKLLLFDGHPATGKTEVRDKLLREYAIDMPERSYTGQQKVLEDLWIDFNDNPQFKVPYWCKYFPLLTFKRIQMSDPRHSNFEGVSVEGFYILLYDLVHQAGWGSRERVLYYFNQVTALDFGAFPSYAYYLKAPLSVCKKRRPDFDWRDRDANEHQFLRFWDWLSEVVPLHTIDATQPVDATVQEIAEHARLTPKYGIKRSPVEFE